MDSVLFFKKDAKLKPKLEQVTFNILNILKLVHTKINSSSHSHWYKYFNSLLPALDDVSHESAYSS